jgi:hypothetical protein
VLTTDACVDATVAPAGDRCRASAPYRAGRNGRPRTRSTFLFIAERRNRISKEHEPLGTTGVYRAVKLAAEEPGLDRARVKPDLLRATAITGMCNAGMHPAMVSEITAVSVAVIARHYLRARPRPGARRPWLGSDPSGWEESPARAGG